MAPFPLIKLGYLAIRQISKPIANNIKRYAKSNPFFRTWICMPPAQIYHWCDINIRLRMMGLQSAKNIEKLTDKEAIELGGEMLGEFVVFSIAAVILVLEYQRGSRKEAAKEERLANELAFLKSRLHEVETVNEIQESQIRDLQSSFDHITKHSKVNKGKLAPIAADSSTYVQKIFGSK